MFTIQLPDALELFKLPRALGNLPTGEPVSANTGQFGPYVQYETVDTATGEVKKKYVSLREHEPLKITLEEAIEVIRAKQEADANKLIKDFGVENLRILRGRWGPYLTDSEKNARLPKDREPETMTLDEARELIAECAPAQAPLGPAGRQEESGEEGRKKEGRARRRAAMAQPHRMPASPSQRKRSARKLRRRSQKRRRARQNRPPTTAQNPLPTRRSGETLTI